MTSRYGEVAVVRADARCLPLVADSVDLIVTSPPYFALRSYTDGGDHYEQQIGAEHGPTGYVDALIEATAEMVRVLKPTGSLWVNLGDKFSGAQQQNSGRQSKASSSLYWKVTNPRTTGIPNKSLMGLPWRYALRCIDELGLCLRSELIWSKPNGLPESIRDRVRRSHEQWFHFTLQDRYYSDIDAVREPYHPDTAAKYARGFGQNNRANNGQHDNAMHRSMAAGDTGPTTLNPLGKLPGSVWSIPTAPLKVPAELGVEHFAAFPPEWPRRLILGWCPPGGVVLDPFGGTGTTAMVARGLERIGISVDLSNDYCRVAQWRTADPKQLAKVAPPSGASQLTIEDVA